MRASPAALAFSTAANRMQSGPTARAICSGTADACSFDDAVHTLEEIQPFHFKCFLRPWVNDSSDGLPKRGAKNGSWKLIHSVKPGVAQKGSDEVRGHVNRSRSAAGRMRWKDHIHDIPCSEPTFRAATAHLATANGNDNSTGAVAGAVAAASDSTAPIELLVKNMGHRVDIEHPDDLEYPHPVRANGHDRIGAANSPQVMQRRCS